MRIVFLRSSGPGVRWFSRYYKLIFPEGANRASSRMKRVMAALRDNPHIGHPTSEPALRKLVIAGSPFHLIYRVAEDRIEILRVVDGRANPLQIPSLETPEA